jgi:hypothetical protein
MKKIIIIIGIFFLIAGIFLVIFISISNKRNNNSTIGTSQTQTQTKSSLSQLPIEELSKKDNLTFQTQKGDVLTKNIYKNPVSMLSEKGVEFKNNSDYSIDFYPQDEGFLIIITNPDVKSALEKAGKDFVETLGISQADACKLKVTVTVPFSVSAQYGGGTYGLNFCPESKQLN